MSMEAMPQPTASQDGPTASLLEGGCLPEGHRRTAAAAQLELTNAAAAKAASAGRSVNRINMSNFENLSEVHIGLCATAAIALFIWMVCMPAFDMSTVSWLRTVEPLRKAGYNSSGGILNPYRMSIASAGETPGQAFDQMDADANGELDLSEFTDGSKEFDVDLDEVTAERIFSHVDDDQDGLIDHESFQIAMAMEGEKIIHKIVQPILPGSTSIQVEEESAYSVGDKVRLRNAETGKEEILTVTGFGSIVFDKPITGSYKEGDTVEVLHVTTTKKTTSTVTTTTVTTTTTKKTTSTVTTTTVTTTTITTTTAQPVRLRRLLSSWLGPLFS